jgi:coproporphyrinogen III oxidase-like Fe-S oxidoreductase
MTSVESRMAMIAERLLTMYLRRDIGRYLNLDEMENIELPPPKPGSQYMLYMHVPFCERLCPYCSFNRFLFQKKRTAAYYQQLREELRMVARLEYDFSALYLGGGTPTVLVDELCETIDLARELFHIREVSCETNPDHLRPELLEKLQGRVQRLSVGMQSFDDPLLKQMNRYDKYGSGEENLKRFQQVAGMFPTLNIDMIFNFPSQTGDILKKDVEYILATGANQTTFYPLMTAPSVARSLSRSIGKVDYRREESLYHILNQGLRPAFQAVSAWCFSRGSSMIDEYIVDHEEYVGIGSGSFSYLNGSLYVNTFSLRDYANRIAAGHLSTLKKRNFKRLEQMRYRFLMSLFGLKLDKAQFKQSFGISIERGLPLEMAFMTFAGAFAENNTRELTLTPGGRYLMVAMMREFFSSMDQVREQARLALAPDEARELLGDYYKGSDKLRSLE